MPIDCLICFHLSLSVGPARLGYGIVRAEVDWPHDKLPQ